MPCNPTKVKRLSVCLTRAEYLQLRARAAELRVPMSRLLRSFADRDMQRLSETKKK